MRELHRAAAAVWQQHRSTDDDYTALAAYASVWRKRKWSAPFLISESTTSPPAVATDGSGFVVVWTQFEAGTGCSLYARILDGNAWSEATALECDPGTAHNPRVASNGGSYSVAWEQRDSGSIWNAYANLYLGGVWTAPKLLELGAADAQDVVVAASSAGYAAAWRQSDGALDRIFVKNYSESVMPLASTALATAGGASWSPQIASNGSGYAVAWVQDDGTGHSNVHANTYDPAGGAWDPANTLVVDALAGDPESPCIVPMGAGYAMAWSQVDGPTEGIYASIHDGAWSAPVNLDSSAAQAMYPRIASDGSSCAVVWFTFDGTSAHTYHARADAGAWGAEGVLGDPIRDTAFPVAAAISGVGYAAVHMQRDGTDPTVWDIFPELRF